MNSPEITRVPQRARIGDESFPLPEPPGGLDLSNIKHVTHMIVAARHKYHQTKLEDWETARAYRDIGPSNFVATQDAIESYLENTPHLTHYLTVLVEADGLSDTGYAKSELRAYPSFAEAQERMRYRPTEGMLPDLSTPEDIRDAAKGSGRQKEPGPTFHIRKEAKGETR
jgi:hypothetical protein